MAGGSLSNEPSQAKYRLKMRMAKAKARRSECEPKSSSRPHSPSWIYHSGCHHIRLRSLTIKADSSRYQSYDLQAVLHETYMCHAYIYLPQTPSQPPTRWLSRWLDQVLCIRIPVVWHLSNISTSTSLSRRPTSSEFRWGFHVAYEILDY